LLKIESCDLTLTIRPLVTTQACRYEQLAQSCYMVVHQPLPELNYGPFGLKSNALTAEPLSLCVVVVYHSGNIVGHFVYVESINTEIDDHLQIYHLHVLLSPYVNSAWPSFHG